MLLLKGGLQGTLEGSPSQITAHCEHLGLCDGSRPRVCGQFPSLQIGAFAKRTV